MRGTHPPRLGAGAPHLAIERRLQFSDTDNFENGFKRRVVIALFSFGQERPALRALRLDYLQGMVRGIREEYL